MREPKGVRHINGGVRNVNGGVQLLYEFENGYGASVIKLPFSYGGSRGLWELAITHGDTLCYDTPITNNTIGYLTEEGVDELLDKIEALPVKMELLTDGN